MSPRFRWLLALAVAHLLVVGYLASNLQLIKNGAARAILYTYGSYSGANMKYGFFAPSIGTQYRAFFDVLDSQEHRFTDTLGNGDSGEAQIRLSNVIALFASSNGDSKVQRALAASWAGKIFGRHPDAQEVWIRVEGYRLPSSKAFRHSERPGWVEIYRARFVPEAKEAKS